AIDQVLVRFLRSVFRKVGTGPAALRGFPEAARILNHTVERHQCRYNELSHDHLLMSAALDRLVALYPRFTDVRAMRSNCFNSTLSNSHGVSWRIARRWWPAPRNVRVSTGPQSSGGGAAARQPVPPGRRSRTAACPRTSGGRRALRL